jgi:hypothetical protein
LEAGGAGAGECSFADGRLGVATLLVLRVERREPLALRAISATALGHLAGSQCGGQRQRAKNSTGRLQRDGKEVRAKRLQEPAGWEKRALTRGGGLKS